jgi:hypothetical protein
LFLCDVACETAFQRFAKILEKMATTSRRIALAQQRLPRPDKQAVIEEGRLYLTHDVVVKRAREAMLNWWKLLPVTTTAERKEVDSEISPPVTVSMAATLLKSFH